MNSEQTQLRIAELRQKIAAGEKLTLEECREAINLVRLDRKHASAAAPKTKGTKAKAAPIDTGSLLAELA